MILTVIRRPINALYYVNEFITLFFHGTTSFLLVKETNIVTIPMRSSICFEIRYRFFLAWDLMVHCFVDF
jgi:hypothetical protein